MNKINLNRQQPTVSIVIPVYNEEAHLAACLEAIARQTVAPHEVVVVDNNSTDQSVAIARRYPFVRVVHEPRQGLVYARTAGFDAARGEIIGRIDADSRLSSNWVSYIQQTFADNLQKVDAVSGPPGFYDLACAKPVGAVIGFFHGIMAFLLDRHNELFLYGSNMAIRRQAWDYIRDSLCADRHLHEDMDMAAHFAHGSFVLKFDSQLRAKISARRADSTTRSFYRYVTANRRTYGVHGLRSRFYMIPLELLAMGVHVLLKLLFRGYDEKTGSFSWRQALRPTYRQRVSPVSETS